MFKRQEKRDKEEKQSEERQTSWQRFANKNKTIAKSKNNHAPNRDPTRDHGEPAARAAYQKQNKTRE